MTGTPSAPVAAHAPLLPARDAPATVRASAPPSIPTRLQRSPGIPFGEAAGSVRSTARP